MARPKVSIDTNAILVRQRPSVFLDEKDFLKEYDFFIFTMSSDKLLRIARFLSRKDSHLGVQRSHKEDRDKEIGQFISSDHPFFPNTIIINFPIEFQNIFYSAKDKKLNCTIEESSAYVIDGQHRLKAFASSYSNKVNLDLVVAAYFGLELPTIAEIFTRINYYQKPVNKSLVYDLLNLNKDPEFSKYREAHEIVSNLNDKIESPLYGHVKMLGIGTGHISQASFVEGLTTRYKILEILGNQIEQKEKTHIIEEYFKAIKNSFTKEWANEKSMLSKSVGFNALVKTLRVILLTNLQKQSLNDIKFKSYTDVMKQADIDYFDKGYGGFKGVNILTDEYIKVLKRKGLI